MTVRTIVKFAANALVGLGAYGLSREIIDNNTATPDTTTEKVLHQAGSVGVAGLVADAASSRVEKIVDGAFDTIAQLKNPTN